MKVHDSRATQSMRVTTDGKNLVSHAGTALLSELADRSGLTDAMSEAMSECGINWHTQDPVVVLTHLAVAIADGADCLADMAALREQSELFGPVASIATAWRAVEATTASELRSIPDAIAAARAVVWKASPPGDALVLDFDATLVNSYSEKEDATPTYKKGFGFFPLGVWCDTTNEPLAAMLRPGRAGANDADHHVELDDLRFRRGQNRKPECGSGGWWGRSYEFDDPRLGSRRVVGTQETRFRYENSGNMIAPCLRERLADNVRCPSAADLSMGAP